MNEAYYNRVMSMKLVDILCEEKYRWLIEYVKENEILDFQTGSNEGSAGKVTRSWFSIYRGTGRVLTLECGSGPKAGLKIHAAAKYMNKDKGFYKTETWERTNVEELRKRFGDLLDKIEKDKDLFRYYKDDKGNKKEGYYQTLISRRYSLSCKEDDSLIIFDKEFVIGYINEKIKEQWNKNPKNWANRMIVNIKSRLVGKCAEVINIPGSECDFVGMNKRGDLILMELKRHEDSTKVYLAPLQVGMYGELLTNLLEKYKDDVEKAIFEMLKQKMKLKMLSPKWKIPERLSGNVRLAVVVGGNSSDEVKRRFKVVRDVVNKDVSHYTCDEKGTLIEVNPFKVGEEKMHTDFIIGEIKGVFKNVEGNGKFYHSKNYYTTHSFVLKEDCVDENLYEKIRVSAKEYFRDNGIEWWGDAMKTGKYVPGHTLSSQVDCLNHLFRIRNDEKAVKAMLNGIRKDHQFKEVKEIESDEHHKGYIAFEVVSDENHLDEANKGEKLTRGSMCTSIDALINAVDDNGTRWIIVIEWKYTETYKDEDKTCDKRMRRYNDKIENSTYLVSLSKDKKRWRENKEDYQGTVYYQEPFYQLMRQTLWAGKMIENNELERVKADDYLHIHVVPKENSVLLDRGFPKVGENMEETWRKCLTDEGKKRYILKDPEELLKPIAEDEELSAKYSDLIEYLGIRYWHKGEQKGKE